MERRIVTTTRECPGRLVPTGDPVTIPAGAFIGLTVEPLTFEPGEKTDAVNLDHIWHALRSVYDPEIPVNIADLGLIYAVRIVATRVEIDMTLTAPGCGMGPVLIEEVKDRVRQVPNLTDVEVELVFDPPWSRDMMSEEAQLELGVF